MFVSMQIAIYQNKFQVPLVTRVTRDWMEEHSGTTKDVKSRSLLQKELRINKLNVFYHITYHGNMYNICLLWNPLIDGGKPSGKYIKVIKWTA